MVGDTIRGRAYEQALRSTIEPGAVVMDLGTGTGLFALMACRLGAGRVYAVDPSSSLQVAREIAEDNGYADRIEFIQKHSKEVYLPEKVDVIVSDLRGTLPLFDYHIPSIIDVRARLLSEHGVLIPYRDVLWVAIVESKKLYNRFTTPWSNRPYGLEMSVAEKYATNVWDKGRIKPEQLLAEPKLWAVLDYTSIGDPDVSGSVEWTAERSGTAHGLLVWFDAELTEDVSFSNAPGEPETIYGSAFFPLSESVPLEEGDEITLTLSANLIGDDYMWRWDTCVREAEESGEVMASFKQSTFYGIPLSSEQLRNKDIEHVPELNREGRIDRVILGMMDGETSLKLIAEELKNRFPDDFSTLQDAISRVGRLSGKYSR